MTDTSTRERFRRNASGIAATAVTGTWLAALLLDFGWWLPLMLFGYIVIVPVVSMLFDEEESAWGGADRTAGRETDPESERDRERELSRHAGRDRSGDRDRDDVGRGDTTDALDRRFGGDHRRERDQVVVLDVGLRQSSIERRQGCRCRGVAPDDPDDAHDSISTGGTRRRFVFRTSLSVVHN